jgi:hypothetical protein
MTADLSNNVYGVNKVVSNDFAKHFIGKEVGVMFKELGPPTSVSPTDLTGGKIYIYAKRGQPHYVFQTDGLNIVRQATVAQ